MPFYQMLKYFLELELIFDYFEFDTHFYTFNKKDVTKNLVDGQVN